jgi:LPXTG-site transpeptidase (sortase) family protein
MRKRTIMGFMSVLIIGLLLLSPITALASDSSPADTTGIAITVVVPRPEVNLSNPVPNNIYPVHVWESREEGRREIVRVYELKENENPALIPREPFERDGFRYELTEIVRRELPVYLNKEHIETISINTQTNDLATILRLLSPTLEYLSEDGYFGVLSLDVSSITIEPSGTRTTSHTAAKTREYPHLSNTDTSLVPRTITENGNTYDLQGVEWVAQNTTAIDYTQVATRFTAIATYTRNTSRTSIIGYTTTAEYSGQVSRVAIDRTEFTAHFIGIPIVVPTLVVSQQGFNSPVDAANGEDYSDPTTSTLQQDASYEAAIENGVLKENADDPKAFGSRILPIGTVVIILLFIAGVMLAYNLGKKGTAVLKGLLNKMKKASCILLAAGLIIGTSRSAFAASLPSYSFGRRDAESVVHLDPRIPNVRSFYNYSDIIGSLVVERLGRRVDVIAGATTEAMNHGAGHFSFTGLNQGNTGLVGHNRGRNDFFDFVRHLREGDILILEVGGIVRSYVVSALYIVDETDFRPLMQFGDNRLTLITCLENQPNRRRVAVALAID